MFETHLCTCFQLTAVHAWGSWWQLNQVGSCYPHEDLHCTPSPTRCRRLANKPADGKTARFSFSHPSPTSTSLFCFLCLLKREIISLKSSREFGEMQEYCCLQSKQVPLEWLTGSMGIGEKNLQSPSLRNNSVIRQTQMKQHSLDHRAALRNKQQSRICKMKTKTTEFLGKKTAF